jgi:hypothetical protein
MAWKRQGEKTEGFGQEKGLRSPVRFCLLEPLKETHVSTPKLPKKDGKISWTFALIS